VRGSRHRPGRHHRHPPPRFGRPAGALRATPVHLPETELTAIDALLRDYITHQLPDMLDAISAWLALGR